MKQKPLLPAACSRSSKITVEEAFSAPVRGRIQIGETAMAVSANRLELLQIADAVAREKSIDQASSSPRWRTPCKAARLRYGRGDRVPRSTRRPARCASRACCWWSTGGRERRDDRFRSPTRASAIRRPRSGDWIAETLPPFDFGRIRRAIGQTGDRAEGARAERDRQYEEYRIASARSSTASSSASNTAT